VAERKFILKIIKIPAIPFYLHAKNLGELLQTGVLFLLVAKPVKNQLTRRFLVERSGYRIITK